MKYLNILKSKAGEFDALSVINAEEPPTYIPLVELLPDEMKKVADRITENWNFSDNLMMLDPHYVIIETGMSYSSIKVMQKVQDEGTNISPVVRLDNPDEYESAVSDFVHNNNQPLTVRITPESFTNALNNRLQSLLARLNIEPENVTLIFDAGYLTELNVTAMYASIRACLLGLTNINQWNDIFVVGGSFPVNLGEFQAGTINRVEQREWTMWLQFLTNIQLAPYVNYGDYGPRHPVLGEVGDFTPSCSIKYLTEGNFMIHRGMQPQYSIVGGGQYHEKCREVISSPHYDGPSFSWADNEINEIAGRDEKPGGFRKWVQIAHARHIAKILSLL